MQINGKRISDEILEKMISRGKNWEKDLALFIQKWLDKNDFIEVKTSGSTGLPKLIKHSKSAMLSSAKLTCDFLGLELGMNALLCLSTNNIAGMMMVVRAFERDLNLITTSPGSHPLEEISNDIKIDFAAMVPAQVYNSVKNTKQQKVLASINNLIVGGAPISFHLSQEIKNLNGKVYSTFGMTETISHVALQKINGNDSSNQYTLLQGISIELGDKGNLVIHAPHLSPEPIFTNDAVEITSDNTFKWLGRLDHVINSGGFKIYAEVVESKIAPVIASLLPTTDENENLATHRYFVGSLPDDKLGERLVLIMECSAITDTFKSRLFDEMKNYLPIHEIPRDIYCVPKFIETPTHKIIRSAILKKMLTSN